MLWNLFLIQLKFISIIEKCFEKFRVFWKILEQTILSTPRILLMNLTYFVGFLRNLFCSNDFEEFVWFRSFDIRAFLSIVQINISFILNNFHNFNKYQKLYIWFWNLTNLLMCKNLFSQFHNQIIKKFLPIQKLYVFFYFNNEEQNFVHVLK